MFVCVLLVRHGAKGFPSVFVCLFVFVLVCVCVCVCVFVRVLVRMCAFYVRHGPTSSLIPRKSLDDFQVRRSEENAVRARARVCVLLSLLAHELLVCLRLLSQSAHLAWNASRF